ncbi:MAG: hypothetical protein N2C14_01370 [Planctomycetales bacterium]
MTRSSLAVGLLALLALLAEPAEAKKIGFRIGDRLVEIGDLPSVAASDAAAKYGADVRVGYLYSFWEFSSGAYMWTWNGRYVLCEGNTYVELTPDEWVHLMGQEPAARYAAPLSYRAPMGLMITIGLTIFMVVGTAAARFSLWASVKRANASKAEDLAPTAEEIAERIPWEQTILAKRPAPSLPGLNALEFEMTMEGYLSRQNAVYDVVAKECFTRISEDPGGWCVIDTRAAPSRAACLLAAKGTLSHLDAPLAFLEMETVGDVLRMRFHTSLPWETWEELLALFDESGQPALGRPRENFPPPLPATFQARLMGAGVKVEGNYQKTGTRWHARIEEGRITIQEFEPANEPPLSSGSAF